MKAAYVMLALATAVFANQYPPPPYSVTDTTVVTYVTTTICPATSTKVVSGTTQVVTYTTTSILTVTSCKGGCGPATVTAPPVYST